MLPQKRQHRSPRTLREELVEISAKIVRHGSYVTFQVAEVAFLRDLFADIQRPIYRSDRRQVWHDEQATIH